MRGKGGRTLKTEKESELCLKGKGKALKDTGASWGKVSSWGRPPDREDSEAHQEPEPQGE